jgi:hypothetical protein
MHLGQPAGSTLPEKGPDPMNDTVPELTGYQAVAAELRRIADAVEHLTLDREVPFVTLGFMPAAHGASPEQCIADVDVVASAVLGHGGHREVFEGGSEFYLADATRAGVRITVQGRLSVPDGEPEADR